MKTDFPPPPPSWNFGIKNKSVTGLNFPILMHKPYHPQTVLVTDSLALTLYPCLWKKWYRSRPLIILELICTLLTWKILSNSRTFIHQTRVNSFARMTTFDARWKGLLASQEDGCTTLHCQDCCSIFDMESPESLEIQTPPSLGTSDP